MSDKSYKEVIGKFTIHVDGVLESVFVTSLGLIVPTHHVTFSAPQDGTLPECEKKAREWVAANQ